VYVAAKYGWMDGLFAVQSLLSAEEAKYKE
jgi:hypothetical protein